MLLLTVMLAASSGWEAKVHFTHDPPRKAGGSDGAIHVADDSVRVEEPTPVGLAVIVSTGGRVRLLFPATRRVIEVDPADAALATVPPLSLAGMKAVGEETIDGRHCVIWEKTAETRAGRVHTRLWVPDPPPKKKLFFFLRYVTQTDRGATKADLSEIHEASQPAALFRVPPGYTRK